MRTEVLNEIHYTQKETDIYKIHQSGDLANLDGLDDAALKKLPNLLKLRNALYSPSFREYLEKVTGAGKLSGVKTDMAINIYTPGSHLLCHDDVIGSRRISYILYLTDPEHGSEWKEEWGGALRLYQTKTHKDKSGEISYEPQPDPVKTIYPAWNQLSFFAVQPGQSFHDVGEVFENKEEPAWRQPMRVAISGWFHIPQEGEDGYIEGEAEALQKQSGLTTLQSSDERFDHPKPRPKMYPEYDPTIPSQVFRPRTHRHRLQIDEDNELEAELNARKEMYKAHQRGEEDPEHDILTEAEAGFLCKYISPHWLTPDQVQPVNTSFNTFGHVVIEDFLHPKYAAALQHYIVTTHKETVSNVTRKAQEDLVWTVAKPPHKHKYLVLTDESSEPYTKYMSLLNMDPVPVNRVKELLRVVFPSLAFRKWLQIITGLIFKSHDLRVRRFRHGMDYQLAKLYKAPKGRVELTLGLTWAGKWEAPEAEAEDEEADAGPSRAKAKAKANAKTSGENGQASNGATNGAASGISGPSKTRHPQVVDFEPLSSAPASEETNHGGYEMFIRGDEDEDEDMIEETENGRSKKPHSHLDVTGKHNHKKADPAVYQTAADDDDDGILLNSPASWNKLSIVLRDQGTMRFVKYVSERSGADRWDLAGEWEVDWERSAKVGGWDDEDSGEDDEGDESNEAKGSEYASDEDEWEGIADGDDGGGESEAEAEADSG